MQVSNPSVGLEAMAPQPHERSLRKFLEILYYADSATAPPMRMTLRGAAVEPRLWDQFLHEWPESMAEYSYRPVGLAGHECGAVMRFGCAVPLRELCAIFSSRRRVDRERKDALNNYTGVFYYNHGARVWRRWRVERRPGCSAVAFRWPPAAGHRPPAGATCHAPPSHTHLARVLRRPPPCSRRLPLSAPSRASSRAHECALGAAGRLIRPLERTSQQLASIRSANIMLTAEKRIRDFGIGTVGVVREGFLQVGLAGSPLNAPMAGLWLLSPALSPILSPSDDHLRVPSAHRGVRAVCVQPTHSKSEYAMRPSHPSAAMSAAAGSAERVDFPALHKMVDKKLIDFLNQVVSPAYQRVIGTPAATPAAGKKGKAGKAVAGGQGGSGRAAQVTAAAAAKRLRAETAVAAPAATPLDEGVRACLTSDRSVVGAVVCLPFGFYRLMLPDGRVLPTQYRAKDFELVGFDAAAQLPRGARPAPRVLDGCEAEVARFSLAPGLH